MANAAGVPTGIPVGAQERSPMPYRIDGIDYPAFMDRDDSGDSTEGNTAIRPQCSDCAHYIPELDTCPAFPGRAIPLSIKLNGFDHKHSIYPGQAGSIRWEPRPKG